jgi:hypothetical protein
LVALVASAITYVQPSRSSFHGTGKPWKQLLCHCRHSSRYSREAFIRWTNALKTSSREKGPFAPSEEAMATRRAAKEHFRKEPTQPGSQSGNQIKQLTLTQAVDSPAREKSALSRHGSAMHPTQERLAPEPVTHRLDTATHTIKFNPERTGQGEEEIITRITAYFENKYKDLMPPSSRRGGEGGRGGGVGEAGGEQEDLAHPASLAATTLPRHEVVLCQLRTGSCPPWEAGKRNRPHVPSVANWWEGAPGRWRHRDRWQLATNSNAPLPHKPVSGCPLAGPEGGGSTPPKLAGTLHEFEPSTQITSYTY